MKTILTLLIVITSTWTLTAQEAFLQLHVSPHLSFDKELYAGKDINNSEGENFGSAVGGDFAFYFGDYNGGVYAGMRLGTNFRGSGYQEAIFGGEFALNFLEEDRYTQFRVIPFLYYSLGANNHRGVFLGGRLALQLFMENVGFAQPFLSVEHDLLNDSTDNMNVYFGVNFGLGFRN
jgi:hypothetical protein